MSNMFARFFCEKNSLQRKRSSASGAPSTTVRSLRELQWSPSPASAGAERGGGLATRRRLRLMLGEARLEKLVSTHRLHPLLFSSLTKEEGKRNADKRGSPTAASCDAARALRGALVCRRSTTALT